MRHDLFGKEAGFRLGAGIAIPGPSSRLWFYVSALVMASTAEMSAAPTKDGVRDAA